jgi:N6-L-threonylcarbamoyladenine synthase
MMKKIICLGIESTAHTFGVGIATYEDGKGKILSNIIKQFTTKKGGMIPAEVADHHVEICDVAVKESLSDAGLSMEDVDVISFSQGPGIGHCLRIGAAVARTLSVVHKKPLVGVNHCISHLEIAKMLTGAEDPVLLYVSGANTQVIAFEAGKYRIFGETLDIGIGNMLDVFARHIGVGFPGGPKIMKLAEKSDKFVEMPYVVKGMDVSFGGLLTNAKTKYNTGKYSKEELCYSLQETVFAMVVEVAERALAHTGKKELALGGGVACNDRLQEMCRIMCEQRGAKLFVPEKQFLVDNGVMMSWLGILEYVKGKRTKVENSAILPYWRTDEV